MLYSCIIPCYNSEKSIKQVVQLLEAFFKDISVSDFEVILVNDCSNDATYERIKEIVRDNKNVIGVDLAKNAGQHNALLAAMSLAKGDYVISLDDDLQTQPSQIVKMIDKLSEGYDVVYGSYESMKQSGFRNLGASFNHYTVYKLLKKPKDLKASSFWIAKRFVIDYLIQSQSNFTNLQGLFLRTTDKIANVEIEHFDRAHGTSTYTLKKLIRLWASCLNYSYLPLRWILRIAVLLLMITVIGFITLVIALFCELNMNYIGLLIILALSFFSSLILLSLGIIAEYLGRMFMVITREPQHVIREIIKNRIDI